MTKTKDDIINDYLDNKEKSEQNKAFAISFSNLLKKESHVESSLVRDIANTIHRCKKSNLNCEDAVISLFEDFLNKEIPDHNFEKDFFSNPSLSFIAIIGSCLYRGYTKQLSLKGIAGLIVEKTASDFVSVARDYRVMNTLS